MLEVHYRSDSAGIRVGIPVGLADADMDFHHTEAGRIAVVRNWGW